MKNFLLIGMGIVMSILFTKSANAQIDSNVVQYTYTSHYDSTTKGLIKARIPFNTLYDRVYPWSQLTSTNNYDTITNYKIKQAWWDLEKCKIDLLPNTNKYKNVMDEIWLAKQKNRVNISCINYNFATIDSMAYADGRLSYDSATQFIADNNTSIDPYLKHQINICALMNDKVDINDELLVALKEDFCLHNFDITGMSVTIKNLTNNENYILTMNQETPIKFNTVGTHLLQITLVVNGASYNYYQKIEVENRRVKKTRALGLDCFPDNQLLESTIPFQGYDETIATTTWVDYHIYYHTKSATNLDCERILKKPIIFLDGYDPQNETQYNEIYRDYLVNFQTPSQNLAEELRKQGYDIVILNFPKAGQLIPKSELLDVDKIVPTAVMNFTVNIPTRDGGTDYVERNSFALVELIKTLNKKLIDNGITNEKLVVVGPSMGGQVARYALAYMEDQELKGIANMDHKTKLYISFDSPHLGANVPIGLSQMLDHFGNFYGQQLATDAFNQKLRCPVARQLLIEQIDGLNGTANWHTTYYNALRTNGITANLGWPKKCRNVGIANGRGDGLLAGIAAQTTLNLIVMGSNNVLAFSAVIKAMPSTWSSALTFEGIGLKAGKKIVSFYTNNYSTTQIYAPILNVLREETISVNYVIAGILKWRSLTYFYRKETTTNANLKGSMDIMPGGFYNAYDQVVTEFTTILNGMSNITYSWPVNLHTHTFIPTVSALAFKNSPTYWNTRIDDRNLVCTGETFFDNYMFSDQNYKHVGISNAIYDFTMQEIKKGHKGPDCSPICASKVISNQICGGSNTQFALDVPLSTYQTSIWSGTTGLTKISANKNDAIFKTNASFSATNGAEIVVDVENNCGANVQIRTRIKGIYPYTASSIVWSSYSPSGCFQMVEARFNGSTTYPTGTQIFFSLDGVNYVSKTTGSLYLQCVNVSKTVWIKLINACGSQAIFSYQTPVYPNSNCGCKTSDEFPEIENLKIEVSPNPTSTEWNITLYNMAKTNNSSVKLYDVNGKEVWEYNQGISNFSNITVPASNLTKGIYMLKVVTDKQSAIYKLMKE